MLGPTGRFTTLYNGRSYPGSYIDSGTETYAFADESLPTCPVKTSGFCFQPARALRATLVGQDQVSIPMSFKVGNYERLRQENVGASDSLAVLSQPDNQAFVWGAPFLFGKRVYLLIEGQSLPTASAVHGPMYGISLH